MMRAALAVSVALALTIAAAASAHDTNWGFPARSVPYFDSLVTQDLEAKLGTKPFERARSAARTRGVKTFNVRIACVPNWMAS